MVISPFQCRLCGHTVTHSFANLGLTPLANDYLSQQQTGKPQTYYPLHAGVCSNCLLVQIEAFETPERIFSDYAYFSSCSDSWVAHARRFTEKISQDLSLDDQSMVIEIASNDGYLLRHFKDRNIPILGVEPAANIAQKAISDGIPTEVSFFGTETARRLVQQGFLADLLIGNNVLAHVPNLNDFVAGLALLLKPAGRISIEFPHLAQLITLNQFDTIYHEHFSYFSLIAINALLNRHRLTLVDVEQLPTHGGSLRIQVAHLGHQPTHDAAQRINTVNQLEKTLKLDCLQTYQQYQAHIENTKNQLLSFLIEAKNKGQTVVGYGAPAKGNTMLNFCGVGEGLLGYTVDISPHKQSLFLPGSCLPIFSPDQIFETKPAYVLILPWNLKEEIMEKMKDIDTWGGKFVTAIPHLKIH